jgi:predicted Zn-dependent protease with MMP-like domain
MAAQVLLDRLEEVRRDRYGATTGVTLGCADHEVSPGPYHRTLYVDDTPPGVHVDVHVTPAQLGQLTWTRSLADAPCFPFVGYLWAGTIAEMDACSEPGLKDPFEAAIDDALSSLPADLRAAMSNVEIVVEDEPPDGQPLLGLYRGVPLPRRSSTYSGVLPDKISIFGGPITRLAAGDADRLRREVRHVVLHEIAHHFGISDERLIELDRY